MASSITGLWSRRLPGRSPGHFPASASRSGSGPCGCPVSARRSCGLRCRESPGREGYRTSPARTGYPRQICPPHQVLQPQRRHVVLDHIDDQVLLLMPRVQFQLVEDRVAPDLIKRERSVLCQRFKAAECSPVQAGHGRDPCPVSSPMMRLPVMLVLVPESLNSSTISSYLARG